MNKSLLNISIIIIGCNSKNYLERLLFSLNKMQGKKHILEIIYIDDGSTDGSLDLFKLYNINIDKRFFRFTNNMGRIFARKKGAKMALGDWFLFLNSNVVVKNNIINQYKTSMSLQSGKAYAGHIVYESKDIQFSKYLNHVHRGINSCNDGEGAPYEYLLFSNCLILGKLFEKINFNLNLKYYGGEELDFAHKLNSQYPNQIIAAKRASVTRKNVPVLENYLLKLNEFGGGNFLLLSPILQKKIVRFNVFLHLERTPLFIIVFLNWCCLLLIKIPAIRKNFYFIRGVFLLNIIKGAYTK